METAMLIPCVVSKHTLYIRQEIAVCKSQAFLLARGEIFVCWHILYVFVCGWLL